jgi:hypothetical protein
MTVCLAPEMKCAYRGLLSVCEQCPTWSGGSPASSEALRAKLAWRRQVLLEEPVLGVDPGMNMGVAVVQAGAVRWLATVDWSLPKAATTLVGLLERAEAEGVTKMGLEVLGKTRGEARARATSWAVMSRTAGRAQQEWERRGLEVLELDPGTWRSTLMLPGSFGEGKKKTAAVHRYARELLGLERGSVHVLEAAMIGLAATVREA